MSYYILDGHKVVQVGLLTWADWFEHRGKSGPWIKERVGSAEISTVFIGVDHQFGNGPPLIFETMVFGGFLDGEQDRYSTWQEAEAGHDAMVKQVRECYP